MALNSGCPHPVPADQAARQLCPQCGLCCNGVLFTDVRISDPAEAEALLKLGVDLRRRSDKWRLPQPCPCFDGSLCRVYDHRPARCRSFACGVLQRVIQRQITLDQAREIVLRTRRALAAVERALAGTGSASPARPLRHRVARALAGPVDLSRPGGPSAQGRLLRAFERLNRLLQDEFLALRPAPSDRGDREP
ncbi:YkgJ family cysteine cluster protein [Limisphaera sp. 4302-co]|uniref:YkgJ family cysteine cluster protein n=1 Tax=Limisphaera sp. 4302-co TaxID=3400417 RepID=UPI003C1BC38F